MHTLAPTRSAILTVQLLVACVALASWGLTAGNTLSNLPTEHSPRHYRPIKNLPRSTPLTIEPLFDDPEVVSDDELKAVLEKIRPVFPKDKLKPNFVEHALRTWGVHARFDDPQALSGEELKDFLVDHGRYLASWGDRAQPLLEDRPDGVAVRWGKTEGASVHHDHWLASLTEAGVSLNEPVFTAGQRRPETIADVLEQSLADFHVDEIEVEWSALAFGLWLPPHKEWYTRTGRHVSFDLLAERLMRGDMRFGVCCGTHRVYSLAALIRLDDDFQILSPSRRAEVLDHLRLVRDRIAACQFPDGHWPSNWWAGADALAYPMNEDLPLKVIATGHHLEWLAIMPAEFHPPREQILKAADWLIAATVSQSPEEILERYTFFSHVGNALALWRKTHPSEFLRARSRASAPRLRILTRRASEGDEASLARRIGVDHHFMKKSVGPRRV